MDDIDESPKKDVIDIVKLIAEIWKNRNVSLGLMVLMSLIGVFLSLTRPIIYTASSKFILKANSGVSMGSNIGGLASLAGLDIGNTSASTPGIPTTLYPTLIHSNPFITNLLGIRVPFNGNQVSLSEFLVMENEASLITRLQKYTLGLFGSVKKIPSHKNLIVSSLPNTNELQKYSLEESALLQRVKEIITITVDNKEGFVNLKGIHSNPEIAAIIVLESQKLLQEKVINFKLKNARETLSFTQNLFDNEKIKFETLQDELANFRDQHQNIRSGLFQNKLLRLETNLAITQNLNEELAKQVEQAKIQVTKDTPIFTIIEPVTIPNKRTSPQRTLIVSGFMLMGLLLGLSYQLIKAPLAKLKKAIIAKNHSD